MIKLGCYNTLKAVRFVDFGVYLGDDDGIEVLLPKRYVPSRLKKDEEIEVFVYRDSENRPIATTERPYATVGQFVYLQVVDVNKTGAFLDWGLTKDLMCPFREQKIKMQKGMEYLVYVYLDDATQRVVASAKIEKFLDNVFPHLRHGDEVDALVYRHTDIGYKAIVNNLYSGLIYENETYAPISLGSTPIKAYVKHVREDGKIDLTVTPPASDRIPSLEQNIIKRMKSLGGMLDLNDKSSPEDIKKRFNCSKKDFKRALGSLYRQHTIVITPEEIKIL